VPYYRARYYFEQPSQLGQGRTWSIFAQDTMTVGSRLTLNLGILTNQDAFAQDLPESGGCPVPANTPSGQGSGTAVFESDGDRCTFVKFGFGDQIQPPPGPELQRPAGQGRQGVRELGAATTTWTSSRPAGRSRPGASTSVRPATT